MDKSKRKTWDELVQIERAKRRTSRSKSEYENIDIFEKSDDNIDIFSSDENPKITSDQITWVDIVNLFYNVRKQYPEVEICEVFLKRMSIEGYCMQLTFKNAFSTQLDICINDGEDLYTTHIDDRLSKILGDKEYIMFEI